MTQKTSFQTVLDTLVESRKDFPSRELRYFSDLDPGSLRLFLDSWPRVERTRKLLLLDGLLTLLDSDTLVSFEEIGRALLKDADPEVRARAIRLLAECDDPRLVPTFVEILQSDEGDAPREEAATLLGEFVMLGELEQLSDELYHKAEDALLAIANNDAEKPPLRRRALEGMGPSSRPEVETLIASAFKREDPEWKASALSAMGRSSDERWEDEVVGMLLHADSRIRRSAVEAAGELSLDSARPILLGLLEDEEDSQVMDAAVWSLSQIGGEDARIYLLALLERAEDDETVEYLEDALENLDFTEGLDHFDLFSHDEEAEEGEEK